MLRHASLPICSWTAACLVLLGIASTVTQADQVKASPDKSQQAAYTVTVERAIGFLQKSQAADGSYSSQASPAITALVATSILRHGRSPDDPLVAKSLKYLERFVHDDGGIYKEGSVHQNYETCVAIMCFAEANKDGRYEKLLKAADMYVKGIQWDESEGIDESNFSYGGAGYGRHKRPDLSNTSFLMDALKATGNGPESEAVQNALLFVSRCQNLESEFNTSPHASKVNDGGFYYTVAAGGSSQAGNDAAGGLRSYASMSYAGLKSMVYAGVKKDDKRVTAALGWIKKNYGLDTNPGMGESGLYYYYQTFAKALDAFGQETVVDSAGQEHDWRTDLINELQSRQLADGSWVNKTDRWLEGDPNLVTGYSLLALSYCKPK